MRLEAPISTIQYNGNIAISSLKITEVNLSAFAYRLFHQDFSLIFGAKYKTFYAICGIFI